MRSVINCDLQPSQTLIYGVKDAVYRVILMIEHMALSQPNVRACSSVPSNDGRCLTFSVECCKRLEIEFG